MWFVLHIQIDASQICVDYFGHLWIECVCDSVHSGVAYK